MELNMDVRVCERMTMYLGRIRESQARIVDWLSSHETVGELPLYSSVDLRDAGFKVCVVDSNLFPAGFNNVCEHGLEDAVCFFKGAIERRVTGGKNILIIAEEHTRNTWYLENVRILEETIAKAGFQVKVATFLTVQPAFCETANYVELETAAGKPVRIYCLKRVLSEFEKGRQHYDLIILNNDLTTGIPEILKNSPIPIYPSLQAGWHSRSKSHHFSHTQELVDEFAAILDIDPWFFSCLFEVVEGVNINIEADRQRMYEVAVKLFERIKAKYQEHQINEKPFIFLKADAGTYGMGVLPIEDPAEILQLNRRNRNNLYKGKSSQIIDRFLVQEGVPTIHNIDQQVSEVCIYQVENNFIGGFYRMNSVKGGRENLNSQGMTFKKMCPHLPRYGETKPRPDMNIFDLYRILARIAAIAAHREIIHLEAQKP